MQDKQRALRVLILNTFAFTVCFAAWMMNGVLITFLVDNGVYQWDKAQLGWLIGIPVLTGSITRLPVGVLTDKYGGRKVYAALMLLAAFFMFMVSYADSYSGFLLAGLGFGVSGASFAVGIAYTSVWFPPQYQGTALGVFGAGNAGAALTSIFAPMLLKSLTHGGENLEGWRTMPRIYAALLLGTALLFWFLTYEKKVVQSKTMTLAERL
ncbi:MAG TPA: MFS transporter, partial [Planctomycetes bacterium]|nr:MFS transporter [Planctomycetota bacterium]